MHLEQAADDHDMRLAAGRSTVREESADGNARVVVGAGAAVNGSAISVASHSIDLISVQWRVDEPDIGSVDVVLPIERHVDADSLPMAKAKETR